MDDHVGEAGAALADGDDLGVALEAELIAVERPGHADPMEEGAPDRRRAPSGSAFPPSGFPAACAG